jgi:hypothetical protein
MRTHFCIYANYRARSNSGRNKENGIGAASWRYRSLPSEQRARSSLSLICPSEQPAIHCRHGRVERGVCTDVTRRDGKDARRNQSEESLRHTSSRGARRCAERQAAPATRGDFGAFLIDIWRLEMAASHWKHTMGAQSNRHVCGRRFAPIFGRENGARMRGISARGDILPPFAQQKFEVMR